jgi:hypothetical protein
MRRLVTGEDRDRERETERKWAAMGGRASARKTGKAKDLIYLDS